MRLVRCLHVLYFLSETAVLDVFFSISPRTDLYIFVPEKHRGRHFPYSCFSFGVLPARTKPVSQARSVDFSVVLVCY